MAATFVERLFGRARDNRTLPQVAEQTAQIEAEKKQAVDSAPSPEPEPVVEITIAPYGERFGNLTRFGNQWIRLDAVTWIDFDPTDGCGAEVFVQGDNASFHMSDEEAAALKQYVTNGAACSLPAA